MSTDSLARGDTTPEVMHYLLYYYYYFNQTPPGVRCGKVKAVAVPGSHVRFRMRGNVKR